MPANIHTSTRGNTLTVRVSGPLDRRIASSRFSRFLLARSRYDELIIDHTGVDEVYDAGLASFGCPPQPARQAGKRLSVVGGYKEDCIAHSATRNDEEHTPVTAAAGQAPLEPSPLVGATWAAAHACATGCPSDAAWNGQSDAARGGIGGGFARTRPWRRWLNRLAGLLSVASPDRLVGRGSGS